MSFGEDFLKGFLGGDTLRDYTHASKTFRSNGYELAPRQKFLFHTFFNINYQEIPGLAEVFGNRADSNIISLTVKNVQLPKYRFTVDTLNQYNRKRLVQSMINYEPVQLAFHDDAGDYVRNLWYNYYSYYYKDPSQNYWNPGSTNGVMGDRGTGNPDRFAYNDRDIYAQTREANDWGYVGEAYSDKTNNLDPFTNGKPAFFRDITVFGFNQQRFAAYVLINPLITNFEHDTYDYAEGDGIMQNTMTIGYETVKYYEGSVPPLDGPSGSSKGVPGFGDGAHYDRRKSDLYRPGSVATILGQGGLIDVIGGIYKDLNAGTVGGLIGAVQKAGTAYETFKGGKLKSVAKEEGKQIVTDVLLGQITKVGQSVVNTPTSTVTDFLKSPSAGANSSVVGGVGTGTAAIPEGSTVSTPKAATDLPVATSTANTQTQTAVPIYNNGQQPYPLSQEESAPVVAGSTNTNQPLITPSGQQVSPDTNAKPNSDDGITTPYVYPKITAEPDTGQ